MSRLLLLAAESRDALRKLAADVRARLGDSSAWMSADAYGQGPHRLAIVAPDRERCLAALAEADEQLARSDRPRRARGGIFIGEASQPLGPTVFLFPGQGSQHHGMLAELCVAFPNLRGWLEELDRTAGEPVTSLIYGEKSSPEQLFGLDGGAQLAFIAGLGLHEILTNLGLRADAMLGHSSGEHAALVASGTFRHDTSETIFAAARDFMLEARSLPSPAVPESSVAVSGCPRSLLAELIAEMPNQLFLAMDNCPSQCVLAGTSRAVERAIERIGARGAICIPLRFEHAYHTPLFDEWRRRLERVYARAHAGRGHTPLYSCAIAGPYPDDAEGCRTLAAAQWSSVVRFGDTIERLYADGYRTFVEVGPGNKLTGFVDDVLRKRPHVAVAACSSAGRDLEQLHAMAAELFVNGFNLDPARFTIEPPRERNLLEEHFALMQEFVAQQQRVFELFARRLGREIVRDFDVATDPILRDHSLGQCLAVVPFTMSLTLAAEARGEMVTIRDAVAHRWLALDQGTLRIAIVDDGERVQIFEMQGERKVPAFECRVESAPAAAPNPVRFSARGGADGEAKARDFYENYAFHGPAFQCIREVLHVTASEAVARLEVTTGAATLLDTAGQLVALTLLEQGRRHFGIFPYRLARLAQHRALPERGATLFARATVAWNQRGTTDAQIVFTDSDGNVVYELENFEQRYVTFPPSFARLMLGRGRRDAVLEPGDVSREFLTESFGIWSRALAHRLFDRDELRAWYALQDRNQAIDALEKRMREDRWQGVAATSGERSFKS